MKLFSPLYFIIYLAFIGGYSTYASGHFENKYLELKRLTQSTPSISTGSNQEIFRTNSAEYTPTREDYIGNCYADVFKTGVAIYETTGLKNSNGQFRSSKEYGYQIILNEKSRGRYIIGTISHEVSHLVDNMTASLGIEDTETEAYLQGFFTGCIQDLVQFQQDLRDKKITTGGIFRIENTINEN